MSDDTWRFARSSAPDDTTNLADDPRLSLMASCVANQQRHAGFGTYIEASVFGREALEQIISILDGGPLT